MANVKISESSAKGASIEKDDLLIISDYNGSTYDTKSVTGANIINPRVQSVTSSATVTANADTNDSVVITAQAAGLTLANPSGTPVQGQPLMIRIKDNGTSRSITYDSQFRAIGVTLPTATTISKTTYLGCIYNSTDTKWDVVGVNTEA
mgnify:CR=1 FL=1